MGTESKIPVGDTGKDLRTVQQTTAAGIVHTEAVFLADPDNALAKQAVINAAPADDEYGVAVKLAGSANVAEGAVTPETVTASATGETTVVSPSAGKAIRLWWFHLQAKSTNSAEVTASLRFGSGSADFFTTDLSQYGGGIAHNYKAGRGYHQGAADQPLIVNLSAAQTVYANVDYEEITP